MIAQKDGLLLRKLEFAYISCLFLIFDNLRLATFNLREILFNLKSFLKVWL